MEPDHNRAGPSDSRKFNVDTSNTSDSKLTSKPNQDNITGKKPESDKPNCDSVPSTSKNDGCCHRKTEAGTSKCGQSGESRNASTNDKNGDTKSNQSHFFQGAFSNKSIPNFFQSFGECNSSFSNFPYSAKRPKKTYKNSEEYFEDLRQWVQEAFFWQSASAAFPYFMMCQQFGQLPLQCTSPIPPTSANNSPPSSSISGQVSHFPQFPMPGFQQQRQDQPTVTRQEIIDGVECRIPSFWKRIAAEVIDFLLLFFFKIAVTYVAVDFFHFVDMDTLDLFQKDVNIAYKSFIQLTQDIFILEMIHRLVVCAFETFWLIGGQNGRLGGATPGKSIMGLRVISCDSSSALAEGDDRVVVKPGGNLGLGSSFLRALTKNFVLALLIPTSFAFIFFPHNRTGYDMICNTIVVEEPIVPHRVHQD